MIGEIANQLSFRVMFGLQRLPVLGDRLHHFRSIKLDHDGDVVERHVESPYQADQPGLWHLPFGVVAIPVVRIDVLGGQQTHLVIDPQGLDRQMGTAAELARGQHRLVRLTL